MNDLKTKGLKTLTMRISPELHARFKAVCAGEGVLMVDVVRNCITTFINQPQKANNEGDEHETN